MNDHGSSEDFQPGDIEPIGKKDIHRMTLDEAYEIIKRIQAVKAEEITEPTKLIEFSGFNDALITISTHILQNSDFHFITPTLLTCRKNAGGGWQTITIGYPQEVFSLGLHNLTREEQLDYIEHNTPGKIIVAETIIPNHITDFSLENRFHTSDLNPQPGDMTLFLRSDEGDNTNLFFSQEFLARYQSKDFQMLASGIQRSAGIISMWDLSQGIVKSIPKTVSP